MGAKKEEFKQRATAFERQAGNRDKSWEKCGTSERQGVGK